MDYTKVGKANWQRLEKSTEHLNYVLFGFESSLKQIEKFKNTIIKLRTEDTEIIEQLENRVFEYGEKLPGLRDEMDNKLNEVSNQIKKTLKKTSKSKENLGYDDISKKLDLMAKQLEDVEKMRDLSIQMLEELENERNLFDYMMKRVDEIRERHGEMEVAKTINECALPVDPLKCLYVLPALMVTLMYDTQTCPYYFNIMQKTYERLIQLLHLIEQERRPGCLPRFATASTRTTVSSPGIRSTQSTGKLVKVKIQPVPVRKSGTALSHGETMAPSDLFAPIAKDSQMTMGSSAAPTPVLSNGETAATSEGQTPIAKDSVMNVNEKK